MQITRWCDRLLFITTLPSLQTRLHYKYAYHHHHHHHHGESDMIIVYFITWYTSIGYRVYWIDVHKVWQVRLTPFDNDYTLFTKQSRYTTNMQTYTIIIIITVKVIWLYTSSFDIRAFYSTLLDKVVLGRQYGFIRF